MLFCLICINMIAIISGGGMVGFGTWLFSVGTSPFEVLSATDKALRAGISIEVLADVNSRQGLMRAIACLMVIIGTLAVTVALFGIMALIQTSPFLATVYKVAVVGLLISHTTVTIYIIAMRPDLESKIQYVMETNQNKYFIARTRYFNASPLEHQTVTIFYERMHISLSCCGVMTLTDVRKSAAYKKSLERDPVFNALVPYSCCQLTNPKDALNGQAMRLVDTNCPYVHESNSMHQEPCFPAVYRAIKKIVLPAVVVCGVFSLVLAAALGMMAAEMCTGLQLSSSEDSFSDDDMDLK